MLFPAVIARPPSVLILFPNIAHAEYVVELTVWSRGKLTHIIHTERATHFHTTAVHIEPQTAAMTPFQTDNRFNELALDYLQKQTLGVLLNPTQSIITMIMGSDGECGTLLVLKKTQNLLSFFSFLFAYLDHMFCYSAPLKCFATFCLLAKKKTLYKLPDLSNDLEKLKSAPLM